MACKLALTVLFYKASLCHCIVSSLRWRLWTKTGVCIFSVPCSQSIEMTSMCKSVVICDCFVVLGGKGERSSVDMFVWKCLERSSGQALRHTPANTQLLVSPKMRKRTKKNKVRHLEERITFFLVKLFDWRCVLVFKGTIVHWKGLG